MMGGAAPTLARCAAAFAAALALALLLYLPSLGGDFFSDDVLYLEENPLLRLPLWAALSRVFGEPHFSVGNWSPLHALLLHLEWQCFGASPLGYRLVNVALHVATCGALAAVTRRAGLSRRAAGLAGLALLVHPVAVEAVAWINQSKTLLATGLSLWALERWLRHLERPRATTALVALALAVLAQLAKPAALALPAVLAVAVATHGRGRWRSLGWLALLAVPSAATLYMSVWAQAAQGGVAPWFGGSPEATLRILPWALWRYVRLSVLPSGLVFGVHPAPIAGGYDSRLLLPGLALLALAGVLAALVRSRPRRALAVAWFGFGLAPVLQVVPMLAVYADRYLYYALPGALALLAEGADRALGSAPTALRRPLAAGLACVALALAGLSAGQARLWADPEALFTRSAEAYPLGRTGWIGLGAALHRRGELDGAAAAYLRALALRPEAHVHTLLGRVRLRQGRNRRALYDFEEALRLDPGHQDADWMRQKARRLREGGVTPLPEPRLVGPD